MQPLSFSRIFLNEKKKIGDVTERTEIFVCPSRVVQRYSRAKTKQQTTGGHHREVARATRLLLGCCWSTRRDIDIFWGLGPTSTTTSWFFLCVSPCRLTSERCEPASPVAICWNSFLLLSAQMKNDGFDSESAVIRPFQSLMRLLWVDHGRWNAMATDASVGKLSSDGHGAWVSTGQQVAS